MKKTIMISLLILLITAISFGAENKGTIKNGGTNDVQFFTRAATVKMAMPQVYCLDVWDAGKSVGTLCWDTGELMFTGNADKSAKVFFKYLKGYIDGYIQDPINVSKMLNKKGFVVVTKEHWDEMSKRCNSK